MTIVQNEIDRVGGAPLKRVVKIELLWDKSLSSVALDSGRQVMIDGSVVFDATIHGNWEIDLVPNSSIDPEPNIYRVTQGASEGDKNATVYYIEVPEDEGDPVWAGSIVVPKPNWVV